MSTKFIPSNGIEVGSPFVPPFLQHHITQLPKRPIWTTSEIKRVDLSPKGWAWNQDPKAPPARPAWRITPNDTSTPEFYVEMWETDHVFKGSTGYHFCIPRTQDRYKMPDWCLETVVSPSFWAQFQTPRGSPYVLLIKIEILRNQVEKYSLSDFPPEAIRKHSSGPHIRPLFKFSTEIVLPRIARTEFYQRDLNAHSMACYGCPMEFPPPSCWPPKFSRPQPLVRDIFEPQSQLLPGVCNVEEQRDPEKGPCKSDKIQYPGPLRPGCFAPQLAVEAAQVLGVASSASTPVTDSTPAPDGGPSTRSPAQEGSFTSNEVSPLLDLSLIQKLADCSKCSAGHQRV